MEKVLPECFQVDNSSLQKVSFAGYKIFDSYFLSLSILNILHPLFLAESTADEESDYNLIIKSSCLDAQDA